MSEKSDIEQTQELFDYLQGTVPDGYKIPADHVPSLTPDQAWTAVWFLQNLDWQPVDIIERCNVCGDLYNSEAEGDCLDYGDLPYLFCDGCMAGDEYAEKKATEGGDNAAKG